MHRNNTPNATCERCGKRLYVPRWKMKRFRFCSRICREGGVFEVPGMGFSAFNKIEIVSPDEAIVHVADGVVTRIDVNDIEIAAAYRWGVNRHVASTTYACSHEKGSRRFLYLHRVLLCPLDGVVVDHIDGDGLNNRRSNLRLATKATNRMNSRIRSDNQSGFRGVSRPEYSRKWIARIAGSHIGMFDTPEEAARAYDIEALSRYGVFARLNFDNDTHQAPPIEGE